MSPSSSKHSSSGSHYLRAKVKHFSIIYKTIKLHPDILPNLISHCFNKSRLWNSCFCSWSCSFNLSWLKSFLSLLLSFQPVITFQAGSQRIFFLNPKVLIITDIIYCILGHYHTLLSNDHSFSLKQVLFFFEGWKYITLLSPCIQLW